MGITRIISGLLGFPLVAVILIFGNSYIIDIVFSFIAIMCIHEYFKSFNGKAKPVQWIRLCFSIINKFYTYNTKRISIICFRLCNSCYNSNIIYTNNINKYENKYSRYSNYITRNILYCWIYNVYTYN